MEEPLKVAFPFWCAVVAVPSGPGSHPVVISHGSTTLTVPHGSLRHQAFPARSPSKRLEVLKDLSLPALAVSLVLVPVFVQAPWVRTAPMAAALFSFVLLGAGIALERHPDRRWSERGALLVGFSGSWLGGSLFWGWGRLHPLWHLPVEAFALPLALGGLSGRWRLAGSFYLASLLGTAATDAAMAFSGVMPLWPQILNAPLDQAPALLHQAALAVLQPLPLAVVGLSALVLLLLCSRLRGLGPAGELAAATLAATLSVDGLFLIAALLSPSLSGLL